HDAADAGVVVLRFVPLAAAELDAAASGRCPPRIRGRVADGPGNGSRGGAMHRPDRAGLAADGGEKRERAFRFRAVLHAGAGTWRSIYRPGDGGRAYPPPAAFRRMA